MSTRKITRKELVQALSMIGINVADGYGVEAIHQFSNASILGITMNGSHVKLNGESDDNYSILIVQLKE